MQPTQAECKKLNVEEFKTSRSTAIANTSDSVQNVVKTAKISGETVAFSTVGHNVNEYISLIPPTTGAYPGATIGSICKVILHDSTVDATDGYDADIYMLTVGGWTRQSAQQRFRDIKVYGDATTQIDVTIQNAANNIARYTFDTTGTAPTFKTSGMRVGDSITLANTNMATANEGTFEVVGVTDLYFEVVNADAVAEVNKTLAVAAGLVGTNTVTYDDGFLINSAVGSAAVTCTLPSASALIRGKEYTVKAGAGALSLATEGSETIDASTSAFALVASDCVTVIADGVNWFVKSRYDVST